MAQYMVERHLPDFPAEQLPGAAAAAKEKSAELTSEGHDVRAFETAEAALAELGLFGPEALVLDVSLPGQSGFQLCQRIPVPSDETHRQ